MSSLKVVFAVAALLASVNIIKSQTFDRKYWEKQNVEELNRSFQESRVSVAKNLVLAIGDGMGVTTATATRVYRGQKTAGMLGEEALLSWDKFPHTGLCKTYCTDMMTPDSGASSTAYHCGVKTKYEMIGVDDTAQRKQCSTVAAATVPSVLDHALAEGKSVGIVTTDAIVGASPSAAYAHTAFRNWRADYELPDDAKGVCKDIARQLIEDNLDIHVLLGGGRKYFLPNNQSDPEYPNESGSRTDGKDLTKIWLDSQMKKGRKARYVTDQAGFDAATPENTDYLFGMFEPDRVQEETERRKTNKEPSVAEMTRKAIEILSKNPKGFYLFIEGGNIDVGHHENRARMALEEGLAFDDAVSTVMNMTSSDNTLVVVSADHSHAFSFGGYTQRGQDILSIANNSYYSSKDETGNYHTVLSYGNGPGFKSAEDRVNLTANPNYYDEDQTYLSVIPLKADTHGGDDVSIFASGPMSHLFNGVHEQTFIAYGMSYAACIGLEKSFCNDERYKSRQ
ncbi:alkaline phosphatase-like [Watersipora subatra]|uniref:alkaline phosphatase-like n=1 Tax=Watersipora subatra TaxID=2589382 RepID=UPI00355C5B74